MSSATSPIRIAIRSELPHRLDLHARRNIATGASARMQLISIVACTQSIRLNLTWFGAAGLALPSQTLTRCLVSEVTVLNIVFD